MKSSRILRLSMVTTAGTSSWLRWMHRAGLLFCLDNPPRDVVTTANGAQLFDEEECLALSEVISDLFSTLCQSVHALVFDVVSQKRAMRRSRNG